MSATLHTKSAGDAPDDTAKLLRASVEMERLKKVEACYEWVLATVLDFAECISDPSKGAVRVAEFVAPIAYGPNIHDAIAGAIAAEQQAKQRKAEARAALSKAQGGAA